MSLEELQQSWRTLEEQPSSISDKQIDQAIKSKYRSFIMKLFLFEIIMIVFYVNTILLTLFRFDNLDTSHLRFLGSMSIGLLAVLLLVRVIKLFKSVKVGYYKYSHVDAIKVLAEEKTVRQKFYLAHIILGFILCIILPIIYLKIYNEYDSLESPYFWWILIPISLLFLVGINHWIKKNFSKALQESQELLTELS